MFREPSPYLDLVLDACEALDDGTSNGGSAGASPRRVAGRRQATAGRRVGASSSTSARPARRTRPRRTEVTTAKTLSGRPLDEAGQQVLIALKKWRSEKAKAASVPAFVIFHDRTLEAIAAARPTSPNELLTIDGVGEGKVSRYGDDLLELVSSAG